MTNQKMTFRTFKQYLTEQSSKKRDYSSTHILLPNDLGDSIINWCKNEIPDKAIFRKPDDPSFGRETEPHVTIIYGLLDGFDQKYRHYFSTKKPFTISLGRMSLFENEIFDVLKIDIVSKELRELHLEMRERFPNYQTFPNYKPHATIAYLEKGKGEKYKSIDIFNGKKFKATEVIFSSKDGTKTSMAIGRK